MPFPEFWRESEAKVIIAEKDILPPFSKIPWGYNGYYTEFILSSNHRPQVARTNL
jgi:hypothetical protein